MMRLCSLIYFMQPVIIDGDGDGDGDGGDGDGKARAHSRTPGNNSAVR